MGGGIMGVSVAYYLALRGVRSTVVDHAGIASCASGKAGGFLARDWHKGTALAALAEKSFDMHAALATTLGLSSYRRLRCSSVILGSPRTGGGAVLPPDLDWVDAPVQRHSSMGDREAIAQVHPKELTDGLWREAQALAGCTCQLGTINGLLSRPTGSGGQRAIGAWVNGAEVAADTVVLCMGPWAQVLNSAVPDLRVWGVKSHSLLLRTERVLSHAVFAKGMGSPEIYPRGNGESYVTGHIDPAVLVAEPPGAVEVRGAACDRLAEAVGKVSTLHGDAPTVARQACYLPWTADELPAMGLLPGFESAYVCAGHGCWGILNAPASGLAMAELILDGRASSLDISPFTPSRLLSADEPSWAPS